MLVSVLGEGYFWIGLLNRVAIKVGITSKTDGCRLFLLNSSRICSDSSGKLKTK